MTTSYLLKVVIFVSALCYMVAAIPKHGNNRGIVILVNGSAVGSINNSSCSSLAMISNSPIRVSIQSLQLQNDQHTASFKVTTELYESQCETADKDGCSNSQIRLIAKNVETIREVEDKFDSIKVLMMNTQYVYTIKQSRDTTTPDLKNETNTTVPTEASIPTRASTDPTFDINIMENQTTKDWKTFQTNSSGIYVVRISVENLKKKKGFYNLTFDVEMRNRYGYLSLVDYPALITYGILLVVYIAYAILWLLCMACYYKDLVRLQFWILAVILLGFLEKIFFVAEYGSANEGHDSSGLIYIAEGVSAGKRALARVLIIIVCEGFGTVKPRLGPTLTKVLVVGGIYFVAAFIDGITRASKTAATGFDLTFIVTFVLLFLIDIGIVYWIFSALVNTRRALRVRKNTIKLSLYNHLAYALIGTVIASAVFSVWDFIDIKLDNCTSDWGEIWLSDCFWHMLFCFVLLVVMIIWRPSTNKLRFAYAQVNLDSEDELEQGANKNFETLTMRSVSKPDKPKPLVMSQEAEDDMKWAEENLPTTIIDKTLPVLLDSEEEVMTTKFESSKMN